MFYIGKTLKITTLLISDITNSNNPINHLCKNKLFDNILKENQLVTSQSFRVSFVLHFLVPKKKSFLFVPKVRFTCPYFIF